MPKPEQQITRWCSNPDTILDPNPIGAPTNGQQNNGFTPNQAPNRQGLNYLFNKLWAWVAWFAGHRPERGHYGPDHPVADNRGLHRAIEQNGAAMQAADDPDRDTRDGNNRVRLYELRSPRPSTNERWRMYADNGAGTGADNTGRLWITWNAWWDADFDGGRWVKDDPTAPSMAVRMETGTASPDGATTYLTRPGGLAVWEDVGWTAGRMQIASDVLVAGALRISPPKTITRVVHPAAAQVVAGTAAIDTAGARFWNIGEGGATIVFSVMLPPGATLATARVTLKSSLGDGSVRLLRTEYSKDDNGIVRALGHVQVGQAYSYVADEMVWQMVGPGQPVVPPDAQIPHTLVDEAAYCVVVQGAENHLIGPLTITYDQTEAVA